jgi:hypothetical protein
MLNRGRKLRDTFLQNELLRSIISNLNVWKNASVIGPFIINRRQGECHLLESLLENYFNSATVLVTELCL